MDGTSLAKQIARNHKKIKAMKSKNSTNFWGNMKNENEIFHHTRHSVKRASQRGIRNPWIAIVMKDGKTIHKQGLKFVFLTGRQLRYYDTKLQEYLKNLVVVITNDDNTILTCYKNKDAIGNIKRKNKILVKNNN